MNEITVRIELNPQGGIDSPGPLADLCATVELLAGMARALVLLTDGNDGATHLAARLNAALSEQVADGVRRLVASGLQP